MCEDGLQRPRQVGATYKTLWTKGKHNAEACLAGRTRKRYKGLDQAPKYVSPSLTYNNHRDYSLKPEHQVSILTLNGRVIVPYTGYSKHVALLQQGAHIGAAKLWYDKPCKQFYLLVTLELEEADPNPESHNQVVGVDVGQRYLAVTATATNDASFYSGKQVRAKADHQEVAVCMSELSLLPPCRPDWCAERCTENAACPARLGEHGTLVDCP